MTVFFWPHHKGIVMGCLLLRPGMEAAPCCGSGVLPNVTGPPRKSPDLLKQKKVLYSVKCSVFFLALEDVRLVGN